MESSDLPRIQINVLATTNKKSQTARCFYQATVKKCLQLTMHSSTSCAKGTLLYLELREDMESLSEAAELPANMTSAVPLSRPPWLLTEIAAVSKTFMIDARNILSVNIFRRPITSVGPSDAAETLAMVAAWGL